MSAWRSHDERGRSQVCGLPNSGPRSHSSEVTVSEADAALQRNIEAFRSRLASLLAEYAGQYVVIAEGGKLVEICPNYEAAVTYGYRQFPSEDQYYLLQKIAPIPERLDIHLACRGN